LSRISKPFVLLVAGIYFLLDAAVWTLAKPAIRWLAEHWIFESVRTWIMSLGPYPTLALFVVPIMVLEPAKPVAAYLTATGHVVSGLMILGVAELLKLALIERLFRISRDKLMSIRAFAWCYGKFQQARSSIESISAWRHARRVALIAKLAIRRYVLEFNESRKREHVSWQSR
jgi:hypothetical protein